MRRGKRMSMLVLKEGKRASSQQSSSLMVRLTDTQFLVQRAALAWSATVIEYHPQPTVIESLGLEKRPREAPDTTPSPFSALQCLGSFWGDTSGLNLLSPSQLGLFPVFRNLHISDLLPHFHCDWTHTPHSYHIRRTGDCPCSESLGLGYPILSLSHS